MDETPSNIENIDPNDWDMKETIFDFIQREHKRLSPKIPKEFEATGFRISYVATTDDSELQGYFHVAIKVASLGDVRWQGRNPNSITMSLIEDVYRQIAKRVQIENEHHRLERQRREKESRLHAAEQSLLDYAPQDIANMADRLMPLPEDVTFEMVERRVRKIAIEYVRELNDAELEKAHPAAFLAQSERDSIAVRCASELRCRARVKELVEGYRNAWPSGKNDYDVMLQIWKLCARQASTLNDVLMEYFYATDAKPDEERTLEKLLSFAPRLIKEVRSNKVSVSQEIFRQRQELWAKDRQREQAEFIKRPQKDWSKTSAPV